MTNICRMLSFVTVCATTLIAAGQSWGQSASSYYEQGVNAFFAGRPDQADSYLSDAIGLDSQDPRAYYFRAFTLMRQGRCAEARGDMMMGARLEAQSPRQVAVGVALERIQGPGRLMLEEIRRQARLESGTTSAGAVMRGSQNSITRPGEVGVLRERRVVPIDEFLRPGGPRTVAAPQAQAPDEMPPVPPAATTPAATPSEAAANPAEATSPAAPNPFEDDSQRPEAKAPPTPPQASPRATTPPAAPQTPPQDAAETPPAATPPADTGNPFNG
jgi:hypothetical protein